MQAQSVHNDRLAHVRKVRQLDYNRARMTTPEVVQEYENRAASQRNTKTGMENLPTN